MRINDKIIEIQEYLEKLMEFTPDDFEEYKTDIKTKAACEHHFEKIINTIIDLSFLIINIKSFNPPEDDESVLDILAQNNIITKNLAINLKKAKGMRNIISHEYGIVDDQVVFEAISEEIQRDVEGFIESIEKIIK